ncbi:MAG: polyphosphate kinase 1, partial [Phycisphaerales bacterium]|nr:polyphosphate kinase 1 [Phycisphaerales bacterium]
MTKTHHNAPPDIAPPNGELYIGRDLAWLDFNERVLAQAEDEHRPLFDRLRFLAICESNLDEFFMKRVALLRRRIELGIDKITHDGLSVRKQLAAARKQVHRVVQRKTRLWERVLRQELIAEGIQLTTMEDLPSRYQNRVDDWFHRHVFPLLTPLAVDPGHPFPFISNLSRNFGVLLVDPGASERRFARVKIPDAIPTWVRVPVHGPVGEVQDTTPCRVVRVADIVRRNLESIFPGMRILEVLEFRVTRGIGLEEDDDDDVQDLAQWVKASLRHRRFAEAVRMETTEDSSPTLVNLILEELELDPESHYERCVPLEWAGLMDLARFDRVDLSTPKWQPIVPIRLADRNEPIFDAIRRGDILLNHPYDSFHASVERFIAEAADDPDVVAIKQCLYRTDPDSPFIHSLLRAAEAGKQVTCLVELRARFDEDRNLQLTRTLEKHGVHVAYGVVGLKTHAKCSLIIRREGGAFRAYAHIGTGNYHAGTATLYSDCGLLTCDDEITGDVIQVFNYLTGRSRHRDYERLLVAPLTMRPHFLDRIEREIEHAKAGRPARVVAKMNQLEDPRMMQAIILASQSGVQCDLIVRGFCCLKAGVPGFTDNVRITSIIGDFLEHSRIYHFSAGKKDPLRGEWYIGSADWMKRNLNQRVEVVTPILDPQARCRLNRIIQVNLSDRHNAWALGRDGIWNRMIPERDADMDGPDVLGTFATLRRDAIRAEVDGAAERTAASRLLRSLPEPKGNESESPRLGGVERLAGLALLDGPWQTAREIGKRLTLSPSLTTATGQQLSASGYIDTFKVGRHTIWTPTPLLAQAVGGPLSLLQRSDRAADWLARRIGRWLRTEGWRVRRGDGSPIDLVAES